MSHFLRRFLPAVVLVFALIGLVPHAVGQTPIPDANVAVDLAQVPVPASDFVEPGFQLLQAGFLDEIGVQSFASRGNPVSDREWKPVRGTVARAYSQVQGLLSDRGDANSEPLALLDTAVIELSPEGDAADVESAIQTVMDADDPDDIDGIAVYDDQQGIIATAYHDQWLVIVHYDFSAQQHATQQNTDWAPKVVAELTSQTLDRLELAIASAEKGEPALGVVPVLVTGPQAGPSQPWPNFPTTQHYRVLDGVVVPYGGELDRDATTAVPGGIDDLFVSRQVFDDERYGYVIDETFATFDTREHALAFARATNNVEFPSTWEFTARLGQAKRFDDESIIQTARVDSDTLRATGFRTTRLTDSTVQIVQWLASGDGKVSQDAMDVLAGAQTSCLNALPSPCPALIQIDLPAVFSGSGETPSVTPAQVEGDTVTSAQFGWSITIPDDGWELSTSDVRGNSEFFEFTSGRTMMSLESAPDHHGDPQRCVLANLALLQAFEVRADIRLGSDDPDVRTAGNEPGRAWAIYTVEPLQDERADQEYVIRFDCYTLEAGVSSLVVTQRTPRDLWTTEREKADRFRDAIKIRGTVARSGITPSEGDRWDTGRTQAMVNSRIWIPLAA